MLLDARPSFEDMTPVPVSDRRADAGPGISAAPAPAARYGDRRSVNWSALILTIAVHIVVLAAFFLLREAVVRQREAKLTVVNLTPAPPPPASKPDPSPPAEPVFVAPAPVVRLPTPVTLATTTPDPVPQPVPSPPSPPTAAPPSPPAPPSIVSAGDLGSKMVAGKAPRYPIESRRRHEQGTVFLLLTLGFDGSVSSISVSRTSGFDRLDDAALSAVRKWRWQPTLRDGQPVLVRGVVEIPFVLQA